MHVDRDRFLEEGYLIVRQVVRPDRLQEVRQAYEILVNKQRAIWVRERNPEDPPDGVWETSAQPRLDLNRQLADEIDDSTAMTVEVWLGERLHGVSSDLLGVSDAGITEMMMMCNPVRDRGPAGWHRDMYPPYSAPLMGYVDDIVENGPRYVQWNISLYEDDVLWVIPGSHIRANTAKENTQLTVDPTVPLPGDLQVHLEPGDGVVYILPILHWGSNYSTKKRRCIHGGFSIYTQYDQQNYFQYLSPGAQKCFSHWIARGKEMEAHTESALIAVLKRDRLAYHAALERLHPGRGEKGKLLSTAYLSKTAKRLVDLKRSDFDSLPQQSRNWASRPHPITFQWGAPFADRFSHEQANGIWDVFKPVDDLMQADTEQFTPGFQGGPSSYRFIEMPADMTVDGFVCATAME